MGQTASDGSGDPNNTSVEPNVGSSGDDDQDDDEQPNINVPKTICHGRRISKIKVEGTHRVDASDLWQP
ncbi:MAG: hypothetical protein R3A47_11615 [Polyangiales bacterium]